MAFGYFVDALVGRDAAREERVGFEPTEPSQVLTISSRAP